MTVNLRPKVSFTLLHDPKRSECEASFAAMDIASEISKGVCELTARNGAGGAYDDFGQAKVRRKIHII